jgi:hypothetical protein
MAGRERWRGNSDLDGQIDDQIHGQIHGQLSKVHGDCLRHLLVSPLRIFPRGGRLQ